MKRLFSIIIFAAGIGLLVMLRLTDLPELRLAATLLLALAALSFVVLLRQNEASPIHAGFLIFLSMATLVLWLWPSALDEWLGRFPSTTLYAVLFLIAVAPPILGRPGFTTYFAKKQQPEAVWDTDVFRVINVHLTWFWAALFILAGLLGLVPTLTPLHGPLWEPLFDGLFPMVLMVGVGLPVTKFYPVHYQRKMGVTPASGEGGAGESATPTAGAESARTCRELFEMMPRGFNAEAADGLTAVYQFEISGDEEFTAHLEIADGKCVYGDGPADSPDVTVKSPAGVWLAISKGHKDGQAAFMAGEYKFEGDLSLLMRLGSLFSG